MRTIVFLCSCMFSLSACEPGLSRDDTSIDAGHEVGIPNGSRARIVTQSEGAAYVSHVEAMDAKAFTAFDLDRGEEVPFELEEWDLAFQRFHIRSRGGVSGEGGVQVVPLIGVSFDELTTAPSSGWLEDQPDGVDENQEVDTVFETVAPWYSYDPATHILTPAPVVYVVRSDRGDFFKLRIEGYYDAAGTPANLTVRWAAVVSPKVH